MSEHGEFHNNVGKTITNDHGSCISEIRNDLCWAVWAFESVHETSNTNKHLREGVRQGLEWQRKEEKKYLEALRKFGEQHPVDYAEIMQADTVESRRSSPTRKLSTRKRSRTRKIFPMQKLCKQLLSKKKKVQKDKIRHVWAPPFKGYHMVNADGSLRKKSGGYGAIVRDHDGKPLAAEARGCGPISLLAHQLLGVELGLRLAKRHGCRKVLVLVNSLHTYMVLLKYQKPFPKEDHIVIGKVINEINKLVRDFDYCQFSSCHSPSNKAADYLSKLHKDIQVDVEELPVELAKILAEDVANIIA